MRGYIFLLQVLAIISPGLCSSCKHGDESCDRQEDCCPGLSCLPDQELSFSCQSHLTQDVKVNSDMEEPVEGNLALDDCKHRGTDCEGGSQCCPGCRCGMACGFWPPCWMCLCEDLANGVCCD